MRCSLLVIAILATGCSLLDHTRYQVRSAWLKENPESEWAKYVREGSVAYGMPKEAVFAAWIRGTWFYEGESIDAMGHTETWLLSWPGDQRLVIFRNGKVSAVECWSP